jgi:pimeloyl-ACP methyl ester carboxylesterase
MTEDPPAPAPITTLLHRARRRETPCGDGTLVWHVWDPQPGQASQPLAPVVLLHGGSGSWTHWVANINALVGAGHQVLAADLPGFGDSARPARGRDADALVEPLDAGLALLLANGPHQQVDLVGFSFGGLTAGLWARALPARIRQLVVVGAPGLGVSTRGAVPLAGWRHLRDPGEVLQVHRGNLAALMLRHPESITALALWIHAANVARDRMPGRRLAHTEALKDALPHITCPVTAIYGRADALYQGLHEGLALALSSAHDFRGLHWVEDAGHWVQFERAAQFDTLLAAVLRKGAVTRDGPSVGGAAYLAT